MKDLAHPHRWEFSSVHKRNLGAAPIGWTRARRIFGDPKPPRTVSEQQFDYCDDALQRLAGTPFDQIDFSDLWYYYHDLA